MKKLILIISFLLLINISSFPTIVREGNVISEQKVQDQKTPYFWKDKNGNLYPIYISKSGKYYIYKVSKKTGKQYKYYLKKDVKKII